MPPVTPGSSAEQPDTEPAENGDVSRSSADDENEPAAIAAPPAWPNSMREWLKAFLRWVRRRIRGRRGALTRLQEWLRIWGALFALLVVLFFWVASSKAGFRGAIEVTLGKSPFEVHGGWWNLPLAILSWLAVPAVTGGLVAYLLERRVEPFTDAEAEKKKQEVLQKFQERQRRRLEESGGTDAMRETS